MFLPLMLLPSRFLFMALVFSSFRFSLFGFQGSGPSGGISHSHEGGGDNEIRTHDPLLARQVLSQLSYTPVWVGFRPIFFARQREAVTGKEN